MQARDTHVQSVPARVISASPAVVPAKPAEPRRSIHVAAVPREGLTLWHGHKQRGETGQMRREPWLHGMQQLEVSEVPCSHRLSAGLQWQNQMPLSSPKLSKEALTSKSVFQSMKSTRLRGLLRVRLERKIPFWCKARTWYPFHSERTEEALLPQLRFRAEPGHTSCLPGI